MYHIAMKFTFTIFLTFSLIIFSTTQESSNIKQPKIWMNRYTKADSYFVTKPDKRFLSQTDFQNSFISKNGSDYIISDQTISVDFTCEADYPITWRFPFPDQLKYLISSNIKSNEERISEFKDDTKEPVNTRYKIFSSIESYSVKFFSVNLTCISTENVSELQSSVYIYVNVEKILENQGKTLQVFATVSEKTSQEEGTQNSTLVIPCRPASPTLEVSLEKQISKTKNKTGRDKSWEIMKPSSKHLKFDPKVGFLLDTNLLGNRIFGFYRCSVVKNDGSETKISKSDIENVNRPFVFVNVRNGPNDNNQDNDFYSRYLLRGYSSLNVNQSSEKEYHSITCCSGEKEKPPSLYVVPCENTLECQLAEKNILGGFVPGDMCKNRPDVLESRRGFNDCCNKLLSKTSVVVSCQSKNVEYQENLVNMFRPLVAGLVTNRSTRVLKKARRWQGSNLSNKNVTLSQYVNLLAAERDDTSEKIIVLIGKRSLEEPDQTYKNFAEFHSKNVYHDYDDEDDRDAIPNMGNQNWSNAILIEYDKDVYYESEPLNFMCFGVKLFYSVGAHFQLNWKNGSKTVLKQDNKLLDKIHKVYLNEDSVLYVSSGDTNAIPIFARTVLASPEMSWIDCWMPKSNSSKWDKTSRMVNVLPSAAPKFVENKQETVYLNLGDLDKVVSITCTLREGAPTPKLIVTKDGKELMIREVRDSNETFKQFQEQIDEKHAILKVESIESDKHFYALLIKFPVVRHEHNCVIQCAATNINQTVTRTIKIIVKGKFQVFTGPIMLSISGVLCLILIALGVKRWRVKRAEMILRLQRTHGKK